ncbi:MAG: hypothetical protein IKW96_07845 [Ruminococcus sp.]|uniref:hypothetical protein n=1 Tax=Ruminococcus sp. TaxID=41978 RepID=UPI0025F2BB8D|nr:hypothetical protein [Ruminococcus sp.]MBR5683177.1 hypothetical protein [Ruminococcus sp.]
MTAATTSPNKKKSFFSVRLKSRFSQDMKLLITNMVFQLLCLPVLMGVLLREMYIDENNIPGGSESLPFVIIAVISLMLSISLGFVIPMMNFRYLYNKSLVDMNYSLPLSNRQRFFADYISGLVVYIVPLLVGIAIAAIELLIGSAFIDMHEFFDYIPLVLKITSIAILGMIMQYSLAVFAISFAGSTFEALFSIAAVNIMIPSFISLTWENIVKAAHFGLDSSSIVKNFTFFTTSPAGIFGYIIYFLNISERSPYDVLIDGKERLPLFVNSSYSGFMLRALLFTAFIVMVTYLLYKHRKAEDVSKPYVYKGFYYAIMSVTIYCIVSLMNMTDFSNRLIAALIISGIIWFVMEVIRRRGFRRFWTAVVGFAAASAAVIGVIKVIDVTNGLGRAKYVPSVSSVTDMEINLSGRNEVLDVKKRFLSDKQLIGDIVEFNREVVDRHFHHDKYEYELSEIKYGEENKHPYQYTPDPYYSYDGEWIKITYYTRSGAAIVRRYYVPTAMLTDFACDLYTSEEFAEQITGELYRYSLHKKRGLYTDYAYNPEEAEYSIIRLADKRGGVKEELLSVEYGKEFFEALRMDMTAMTPEELKNSEYYCSLEGLIINSACHNAVAFMEDHGIKYKNTSKETIYQMDRDNNYITIVSDPEYLFPVQAFSDSNFISGYYRDYDSEDLCDCIKLDRILSLGINRDRIFYDYSIKRIVDYDNAEAVEKLLDIATPIVIDEKVIAEVQLAQSTLYVTDRPGNREIVEEAEETMRMVNVKN